ncbi:hypothetical protein I4F81_002665 [Pyropia yezoensis]|uniref:Uncharacterized protein n=1 Tax=Pyropia yezoensis TaxID=2788 RepID=A0ACC3BQ24_PYRYE|nr:hypothetical protein I4F81_002665 [Neopyropia yezoensis]
MPRLPRPSLRGRELLLVGLDWLRPGRDPPVSLANATIAAAVAPVTPRVAVHTLAVNAPAFDLPTALAAVQPATPDPLIGVGAYVWAERLVAPAVAALAAAHPRAAIVVGGPQVTYAPPGDYLSRAYPAATGFVRGAGEGVLRALLAGEGGGSGDGGAVPAGYHPAGEDDDGTPASVTAASAAGVTGAAATSPLLTGWMRPQPFLRWETSRGCPFRCAFCAHKDVAGRRASLPPSRVAAEADWLAARSVDGTVTDVAVTDPTFNTGPTHLGVLDQLSEGGFRGALSLQCRAEMLTPAFLDAVLRLRATADVTLEFGVQTVVRAEQATIERPANMRRVDDGLAALNAAGVPYEVSLIYGLPGQTVASVGDWKEMARMADAAAAATAPGKGG